MKWNRALQLYIMVPTVPTRLIGVPTADPTVPTRFMRFSAADASLTENVLGGLFFVQKE
jgi:hypothetical protein